MIRRFKSTYRPGWCWYCDTRFPDHKQVIYHQWEMHFKCTTCGKELSSGPDLVAHCLQVHDEVIRRIPKSLPERHNIALNIYGTEGVPKEYEEEIRLREVEMKKNKVKVEAQLRELESKFMKQKKGRGGLGMEQLTLPIKKIKEEENPWYGAVAVAGPSTPLAGPSTSSRGSSLAIISSLEEQQPMVLDALKESEEMLALSSALDLDLMDYEEITRLGERIGVLTRFAEQRLVLFEAAEAALTHEAAIKVVVDSNPVVAKPSVTASSSAKLTARGERALRRWGSTPLNNSEEEDAHATGLAEGTDVEMDVSISLVETTLLDNRVEDPVVVTTSNLPPTAEIPDGNGGFGILANEDLFLERFFDNLG